MGKRARRRRKQANRQKGDFFMGTDVVTVKSDEDSRMVTFMADSKLLYPELWLSIYVAGSDFEEAQFAEMFVRGRCRRAASPSEADLVVFTGGEDVDPVLYSQLPHPSTKCNPARDEADLALYATCLAEGIPMLGICRGAQFLHVMNGGALYQDVDKHYGDHGMFDCKTKTWVHRVSSVHHQMVVENVEDGMEIIAYSTGKSTVRHLSPTLTETGNNKDIEAFFYRETCCIGIQGHPEYRGYNEFTKWSLELVNACINENPDIEYRNKMARLKTDLILTGPAADEGIN